MTDKQKAAENFANTDITKSFVKEDGNTTIACPNCNSVKAIAVGHYRERQHHLKVRCSCSEVFRVNLDFRQCFRKITNISGVFMLYPPAIGGGMVQIANLSLDGICFEINGFHKIQVDQKGSIEFELDNRKQTQLKRDFTVKAINGQMIGCEFVKDQAFEKELGFYLRFGP